MAAVSAHILRVTASAREEPDAVCAEEALQRMPNRLLLARLSEKAVTAVAGVLDEAIARGHGLHAMSKESAGVSDFLREAIAFGEAIMFRREYQRVAAPDAYVFVDAVTIGKPHVGVMPQEAG
jgi:hypothetical protein